MTVTFNRGNVLLTRDDVISWRQQRLAIDLKIDELRKDAAILERKLEAARLFMGEDIDAPIEIPQSESEEPVAENRAPMTDVVLGLFSPHDRFAPGEVVELVGMIDGVAGTKAANANNIYTSLRRLTERKKLTRHEDGAYTLFQEAEEPPSGEPDGGSEAREGHPPSLSFNP